jgi:hypothetical protein
MEPNHFGVYGDAGTDRSVLTLPLNRFFKYAA